MHAQDGAYKQGGKADWRGYSAYRDNALAHNSRKRA